MALDKFPVDESALPRVEISPAKLDEWKQAAYDEIQAALADRHSWYNAFKDKIRDGFDMIADRPNLKAFMRSVPNSSDKSILIRSTCENVTLDDIGFGIYAETSYEMRCVFAHMYEENFLDAGILHTHETRSQEDPLHFVGLRWIAFRSPAPKIVTSRDFVFFSYEGTTTDVKGERVIFRFLRTMPMEDVPVDSSKLPPLVRGKLSNLHIYRQNGANVEAYVQAMHSNAGSMPSYVVTKTISFMFPGVTNMETIGDARALMRQGVTRLNPSRASTQSNASMLSSSSSSLGQSLGPRGPASLASANACGVCYHKFKMTRSKRQCHGCSRTVCKKCTRSMWFFDEQKQMSGTGVAKLRFCHNCMRHARADASLSRASLEMTPNAAKHGSRNSTPRTTFPMDGSRAGSSASVSSQGSLLARTPSHDNYPRTPSYESNGGGHYPRTPSYEGSGHNYPRTPSHDSSASPRIPRVPSHQNVYRGVRGTSHASQASSHHSKTSSSSHTRSQPEAEFSDEDIVDDNLLDLHDGSFAIQPTQSPPTKPFASSKIMSFKSSSSSSAATFSSSQLSGGSSTPTTKFDSSQVVNAFDGSPVIMNPMERSHIGDYAKLSEYSSLSIPIMSEAGDSDSEGEDFEDFGDFHDSDSDHEIEITHVDDVASDYDADRYGAVINHTSHINNMNHLPYQYPVDDDRYSEAFSIMDTDDYSIAGSFSYDMGPQSFMDDLGSGSFSFDVDDNTGSPASRGSFVPLTMLEKPSVVQNQFSSTVGPGSRPLAAAPVPQLTQRRLPPQLPPTLRNYPPPTGAPLDEPVEFDGSATMPLVGRSANRTSSTPNLLAYGMTKRTNRHVVVGMAPVRRTTSGTGVGGGGVIVNGVNHTVQSPGAPRNGSDLATDFQSRVHLHETNGGGNSPMVRYYGS